jgi:hypothetical protein
MSGLDIHLDVVPLSTDAVSFTDANTDTVPRDHYVPVLGGGIDLEALRFGESRASLVVGARLDTWGGAWDLGFDHLATSWTGALDVGCRWTFGEPVRGPGATTLFLEVGGGLRGVVLSQSWWEDYVLYGVGGHAGIGLTIGEGRLRGLLGLRVDVNLIPSSLSGSFFGDDEYTWTWNPSALRGGAVVGVAFR